MACVSESDRRNAKQLRPYAGRGAGGGCGCAATPPHEIIALTGPHPMRAAATGAQDLRLALDVSGCDEIDIELRVLALEGTGPSVTISIETGMQCATDHGWVTLATFPAVSAAPGMHIRRLRGFLRYLRWNVTTLSGSGTPAATFLIDGVARAWGHDDHHEAFARDWVGARESSPRGRSRVGLVPAGLGPAIPQARGPAPQPRPGGTNGSEEEFAQAGDAPAVGEAKKFHVQYGFDEAVGDPPALGDAPDQKFTPLWRTWTVWHWNVAGDKWHKGSTTNGMVDAAVDSIIEEDADFATFNELCRTQFEAIKEKLSARGWPDEPKEQLGTFAEFSPSTIAAPTTAIHCGVPWVGQSGEAVFSRKPIGEVTSTRLAYDGKTAWGVPTHRLLLCALLRDIPLRMCTTHLSFDNCPSETINPDTDDPFPGCTKVQLDQVRGLLNALSTTWILGGDLNAPHSDRVLDEYYAPSAGSNRFTGSYRELDDLDPPFPGAITGLDRGDKIDYFFVPEDKLVPGLFYDMDAFEPPYRCLTGGHPDSFDDLYKCLREELWPFYFLLDHFGIFFPQIDYHQCCSDHRIIVGHVALTF